MAFRFMPIPTSTPWRETDLKNSSTTGATHLLFTYGEFIEKLVALVPPPRSHLVRWAGVFAPNSPYRKEISLEAEIKKGFQFESGDEKDGIKNYSWSKMLAKVFKIDVTKCEGCGGEMQAMGSVQDRLSVERYLKHVGIDHKPPARAPPSAFQQTELFDQSPAHEESAIYLD
jgi:hypothetical protein